MAEEQYGSNLPVAHSNMLINFMHSQMAEHPDGVFSMHSAQLLAQELAGRIGEAGVYAEGYLAKVIELRQELQTGEDVYGQPTIASPTLREYGWNDEEGLRFFGRIAKFVGHEAFGQQFGEQLTQAELAADRIQGQNADQPDAL